MSLPAHMSQKAANTVGLPFGRPGYASLQHSTMPVNATGPFRFLRGLPDAPP
jgi:hypothetical protein